MKSGHDEDDKLVLPEAVVTEDRVYKTQDAQAWSAFYSGDYKAAELEFTSLLIQVDVTAAFRDQRGFSTDIANQITVIEVD